MGLMQIKSAACGGGKLGTGFMTGIAMSILPKHSRTQVLLAFLAGAAVVAALALATRAWQERVDDAAAPAADGRADGPQGPAPHELARLLRQGGYILYFRHGQRQKWDSVIAFDVHELATGQDASQSGYRDAVCLTPQGKEEARMIGATLALGSIPVGHVAASPVCRARQTAQLAFGRIDGIHMALAHTPVTNPSNAQAFKDELGALLRDIPVRPGTNTVITAHENTIRNHLDLFASGTSWLKIGMVQETGLYVIRRDGRQLHIVRSFPSLGDLAAAAITLPVEPARGAASR